MIKNIFQYIQNVQSVLMVRNKIIIMVNFNLDKMIHSMIVTR